MNGSDNTAQWRSIINLGVMKVVLRIARSVKKYRTNRREKTTSPKSLAVGFWVKSWPPWFGWETLILGFDSILVSRRSSAASDIIRLQCDYFDFITKYLVMGTFGVNWGNVCVLALVYVFLHGLYSIEGWWLEVRDLGKGETLVEGRSISVTLLHAARFNSLPRSGFAIKKALRALHPIQQYQIL